VGKCHAFFSPIAVNCKHVLQIGNLNKGVVVFFKTLFGPTCNADSYLTLSESIAISKDCSILRGNVDLLPHAFGTSMEAIVLPFTASKVSCFGHVLKQCRSILKKNGRIYLMEYNVCDPIDALFLEFENLFLGRVLSKIPKKFSRRNYRQRSCWDYVFSQSGFEKIGSELIHSNAGPSIYCAVYSLKKEYPYLYYDFCLKKTPEEGGGHESAWSLALFRLKSAQKTVDKCITVEELFKSAGDGEKAALLRIFLQQANMVEPVIDPPDASAIVMRKDYFSRLVSHLDTWYPENNVHPRVGLGNPLLKGREAYLAQL